MGTRIGVTLALAMALCGCESLTYSDKEILSDLAYYNIEIDEHYDPLAASMLNFLPGIGNFYLDQNGEGIANLLFWPLSIFWGMPQAWIDAKVLNKKVTADFYRTRAGKERMARLMAEAEGSRSDRNGVSGSKATSD